MANIECTERFGKLEITAWLGFPRFWHQHRQGHVREAFICFETMGDLLLLALVRLTTSAIYAISYSCLALVIIIFWKKTERSWSIRSEYNEYWSVCMWTWKLFQGQLLHLKRVTYHPRPGPCFLPNIEQAICPKTRIWDTFQIKAVAWSITRYGFHWDRTK